MNNTITVTQESYDELQSKYDKLMNALQRETDLRMLERQHEKQFREQEIEHELNKKSGFRNFTMINNDNLEYLTLLADNPSAMKLYLFIVKNMNNYNALMASYQIFEDALGYKKSTIAKAIKDLKDLNLLYIYKSGSSNVYVLNDDLVWKSYGNNRKYCKFPANVMLASSEQDDEVREKLNKIRNASKSYETNKELVSNDK